MYARAIEALKNIQTHVTKSKTSGQLIVYGISKNGIVIKFVIQRRKVQTFHPDIDRIIELTTTGKLS